MTPELIIRAIGTPARQGSKSFKGMRGRFPVFVEADPKLPKWRADVIDAAKSAMRATGWLTLDGPIEAWIEIYLRRPKTVTREYPESKSDGDGDKYVRAIFDACTIAGVWVDDSRVVDHHARKRYCEPGQPAGARIRVSAMADQGALV